MDYFCYVSQSKIDQLFEHLEPSILDSWEESSSTEREIKGQAKTEFGIPSVIKLFEGGASYGRKDAAQFGRKLKRGYIDKLTKVLTALSMQGKIYKIESAFAAGPLTGLYYHHIGGFRVESDAHPVAKLSTQISVNTTLFLDCSIRYFSESANPDGTLNVNSSNSGFFSGSYPLRFETVFLCLHQEIGTLNGSPLFLKLHAPEESGILI